MVFRTEANIFTVGIGVDNDVFIPMTLPSPGVNFTSVLLTALMLVEPESVKNTV